MVLLLKIPYCEFRQRPALPVVKRCKSSRLQKDVKKPARFVTFLGVPGLYTDGRTKYGLSKKSFCCSFALPHPGSGGMFRIGIIDISVSTCCFRENGHG